MKHEIVMVSPMYPATMEHLEQTYTCHRLWEAADPDALLDSVADRVTAITATGGKGVSADRMARLPRLKLVACFGVGVDAIDVPWARAHGVAVTNTPEVLTEDVADLTLALLLATIRRIPQSDRHVREGKWLKGPMGVTGSMQGKRIGLIGLGRIGRAIARRCEAFNTRIAYTGPRRKSDVAYDYYPSAVELAANCDVLIAACPGGPETNGIVSREVIAALGPQGCFINIARGSVVDEPALVEALASGRLGSAGLDVFADEPRVPQALIDHENAVLLPHVGSGTHATRAAMGQLVIDNLAAYFAGKPLITPV